MKILGVLSDRRHPEFPNVPTFAEQGFGYNLRVWGGFLAPLGVPREVVDTLSKTVEALNQEPEMIERLVKIGWVPFPATPERLRAKLGGGLAHGVISDMAANTTGHKKTDHLRIIHLAELAARGSPAIAVSVAAAQASSGASTGCWRAGGSEVSVTGVKRQPSRTLASCLAISHARPAVMAPRQASKR